MSTSGRTTPSSPGPSPLTREGRHPDLGKALGLPREDLNLLSRKIHSHGALHLREEMLELPAFRDRVEAPGLARPP